MTRRISLTQYLVEQQRSTASSRPSCGSWSKSSRAPASASASASRAGALGDVMGSADSENVQGEIQKKLDIIANEVLIEANEWGGHLAAMASEEMEGIYVVPNRFPQGEYLLLFDPLDGSSTSTST
jgi:fructose-1,6-bisphosphatase I